MGIASSPSLSSGSHSADPWAPRNDSSFAWVYPTAIPLRAMNSGKASLALALRITSVV
jgi:hypothetical protein